MQKFQSTELLQRIRKYATVEVLLGALALIYIGAFHSIASEDRLLLNLYYIGLLAATYALVRRRAFAITVLVVLVAGGTTLAQVYFAHNPKHVDPLLTPVVDLVSLCVLLLLGWRLAVEAYRFQTEEYRLQIQRQIDEKAMATRAAALTSTSHEVRQPLTAILAISETLLDGSTGPMNEVQKDFVADMDECAHHLMDLVNNMLDCAKAESGMIELAPEAVALPELVGQCVTIVESKAESAGVSITARIDSTVQEVIADPIRLKQILINLLTNAVKFNEKNGFVKMQVRADHGDVLISVRDTGRGIHPEQIGHLFDPYYQAARGDQGIGTGLGLSIVKHLVELHHGEISVESVPGSGSVFTVRLPRTGAPGAVSEGPSSPDETRRSIADVLEPAVEDPQSVVV